MPTKYVEGSSTLTDPTVVQARPFADSNAVTVLPRSSSFNQYGAPAVPPDELVDKPPADGRRTNAGPLPAVRNIDACAALLVSESRIMMPPSLSALTN